MDRRAFAGLMLIEAMLAFGNTFAASFNLIYLFKHLDMPIWTGPIYLGMGFFISIFVSLWMSWKPHLDPRNAMLVGLLFLVAEYALFLTVRDGWLLITLVGCSFGLFYPLFWTPMNILMAQLTDKDDRGVTYGAFFFVWPLVTFIAPFFGGVVIGWASYQVLFALGIIIIGMTALMIIAYRNYIPKDQVMKIRLDVIGRRNVVSVLGEGGFEGVFWIDITIIAYMFTQSELDLGTLFSLFGLAAGAMAVILGKISDKIQDRRTFVVLSTLASVPCALLIGLADNLNQFAIATGLLDFAAFAFPMFVFAILTDKFEEAKNDSVLGREYLLDIGRASSIGLLVVLLYLGVSPQHSFLLTIPFLLMGALAWEPKKAARPVPGVAGHADQLH
jgi:MFS family permease